MKLRGLASVPVAGCRCEADGNNHEFKVFAIFCAPTFLRSRSMALGSMLALRRENATCNTSAIGAERVAVLAALFVFASLVRGGWSVSRKKAFQRVQYQVYRVAAR